MTIDTIGPILPGLAQTRRVIAAEMQGHGRTADIDRPITYEHMAVDVAQRGHGPRRMTAGGGPGVPRRALV